IFITAGFVERTRSLWWETAAELTADASEMSFDFGAGPQTVPMATLREKQAAFERIGRFVQTRDEDAAVGELDRAARAHGIDPLAMTDRLVMDAGELRALSADPLARFGAHTLTHVALARVDEARLRREMAGSIEAVEAYVGRRPA